MSTQDKIVAAFAFIVVLAALVLPLLGAEHPAAAAGAEMTVTGEVVDLWCYLDSGARGADHKACAIACMNAGNPVGIADAKGDVYVAMGAKDMKPGKDVLKDKMAETVTVTGKVIKKGGVQAIYISSVK